MLNDPGAQCAVCIVGKLSGGPGIESRAGIIAAQYGRAGGEPHDTQRPDSTFEGTLLPRQAAAAAGIQHGTVGCFIRTVRPERKLEREGTIWSLLKFHMEQSELFG